MVLYHFSEEATIARFVSRQMATRPGEPARVWAIDATHEPLYLLPRDCPRVCCWALPTNTPADRSRFLGQTSARVVVAIEGGWLDRVRTTQLYRYELPDATFIEDDDEQKGPGYYVSSQPVVPLSVQPVGDLLASLLAAGVEIRLTPSLWPLYHALLPSTMHYSMIRMRNAQLEQH